MTLGDLLVTRLYEVEESDPVAWVEDRLDEELWSKQEEILVSVWLNRKTAVKSCHGVGKSHIASRAAAAWLDMHPPGEAFVVSTAPSFPQVRAILWRYIGQAHRKGRLRGRVTQTEWHIGDELVGFGRKPADHDEAGFQGIHAKKVLVIIDEACGVPKQLWDAVASLLTNDDCRVLAIGNPDNPTSHFAEVCQQTDDWNVITISAFDSPNFTGEAVSAELRKELVGSIWVDEARRMWGVESPVYIAKVLGEFPEDAADGIVPGSAVAACRVLEPEEPTDPSDVQLGVDVGAGGDQSIIRERRGMSAGRVWRSRHDDPMRLAGEVLNAIRESGATRVAIDVIGIGWGVKGRVEELTRELGIPCEVVGVNVSTKSKQPKRFVNLRAELWWELGRMLSTAEDEEGRWRLGSIDDQTAADLAAPEYTLDSAGRIVVEKKDEVRRRIGRSPDDADGLLLAFYRGGNRTVIHRPKNLNRSITSGRPRQATLANR